MGFLGGVRFDAQRWARWWLWTGLVLVLILVGIAISGLATAIDAP